MNTPKTIEIIISSTGEATVQTKGFMGSSCRDASRAFEQALGIAVFDKPTTEMYQTPAVNESVHQGNG